MTSRAARSRRCGRSGHEAFNLGSDEPLKLSALITLVEKLTGCTANQQYKPGHPADVPATWADISKAQALLGWSPQTSFEQGMKNLVDWYEENRSWAKDIDTD